jgi:uncharacterized protein YegL
MGSIDINLVLDASGSMHPLVGDTVGGVNHFLDEQRAEPGDAYITLVTFDSQYKQRFAATKLLDLKPLTVADYYEGHGGSTALLDAVGKAITSYEALPVKADKTLFVIATDGLENASREFDRAKVRELIEKHQNAGWAFVFLGANSSEWQGSEIGARSVGAFVASPAGVAASYGNLSANTSRIRGDRAPAAATAAGQNWSTGEEDQT